MNKFKNVAQKLQLYFTLIFLWMFSQVVCGLTIFSNVIDDSYFLRLNQLSFPSCKTECEIRLKCRSIAFNKRTNECDLYEYWIGENVQLQIKAGYSLFSRKKWKFKTSQCGQNSCSDLETCDKASATCIIKECLRLVHSKSSYVTGNRHSTGAKIRIECAKGYMFPDTTTVKAVRCRSNGNWTSFGGYSEQSPYCVLESTTTTTTEEPQSENGQ